VNRLNKPRIGIVGLGSIAQKAYLPILTKEDNWTLVGAYTPNEQKRNNICNEYRIKPFDSLQSLSNECDAIFVHSSTSTHYEIVSELLQNGKDVYVDKPLAANIVEAEKLVELSIKHNRKLMVGFNRRFAPMYIEAKNAVNKMAWVRMEKHRANKVKNIYYAETILDDYIHLVDTVRWIGDGSLQLQGGTININEDRNLIHANHNYMSNNVQFFTGMHRQAGTGLELLELVGTNRIVRVKNLDTIEIEQEGELKINKTNPWDTILKEKGFVDAINHFIDAIINDTEPMINGEEAFKTQKLVNEIINQF